MSSNDELNIAVAEALGVDLSKCNRRLYFCCQCFKEVDANHGFDHQVLVYSKPCPNYAGDMSAATWLLDGYAWEIYTCDQGYRCQIYKAPEEGEAVLGNGVGATPAEAICRAFLDMKKGKG